jgi:hypothetical protein
MLSRQAQKLSTMKPTGQEQPERPLIFEFGFSIFPHNGFLEGFFPLDMLATYLK